ncbi:hypothetical protein BHM03_00003940 [Ensete ventricosum]|uniref:Uncharacterized protein n=1 Tax=Ensete ventricosum TaxID=4639 RepID=A0A445MA97_ENSVE|nr:hypothetical protein BHM03_00003940 [Ensete ventricosum]
MSSSPAHYQRLRPRVTRTPSSGERPHPLFLPREETQRLPARGERLRRPVRPRTTQYVPVRQLTGTRTRR